MPTQQIPVPGASLHVVDEGAGPPVVLLHAGIADLRSWDALAPRLVAAGYRVVRYDSRGFGQSPTEDVEFSNRADLVAVLDGLGIGRAALVGNSRGGSLAFDTAIESPERVVAVVGVGAGLSGFDGGETADELPIIEEYERVDAAEPFDAVALDGVRGRTMGGRSRPAGGPRGPGDSRPGLRDEPAAQRARPRRRHADPARSAGRRAPGRPALSGPRGGRRARHEQRRGHGTPSRGRGPGRTGGRLARCGAHDRDGAAGAPGDDDRRLPRSRSARGPEPAAQRATSTIVASTSAAGTPSENVRMSWRSTGSRSP